MQDYEYKDEGGRFLCRLHHRIRCDECHYVSDLRDENKRYREALEKINNNRQVFYLTRDDLIKSFYDITKQALKE